MEITCVIEVTDGKTSAYDTSYRSFLDLTAKLQLSTKFYIVVFEATVDLSLLIRNTIIGRCTTWEEVSTSLTQALVDAYTTTFRPPSHVLENTEDMAYEIVSYPSKKQVYRLKVHSCLDMTEFGISYGSVVLPALRNIYSLKWKLKDIIITKKESVDIDFNNCIPVVNGIIQYPIVYEDELYIKDGTENLSEDKEVLLMDTSPLGGMDIIKFSDCTTLGTTEVSNQMKYILPEGKSMQGKTPILVVAGRMYFKHEFFRPNDKTIVVDPQLMYLRAISLKNHRIREEFVRGTTAVQQVNDLLTIRSYFDEPNSYIVLIDNPDVIITETRPLMNININATSFPSGSRGILVNTTRDILDYTKIEFNFCDLVTYTPPEELMYLVKNEVSSTDIAFTGYNYLTEELENLNRTDVKLIDISLP